MQPPYLQVQRAEGSHQVALGEEPITIGRHSTNKLVLNDDLTSRFHCKIEKTPQGYCVTDLGSKNKTRVNGKPVTTAMLSASDVLRVGRAELKLVLPAGEAPAEGDSLAVLEEVAAEVEEISAAALEEVEEVSADELEEVAEEIVPVASAGEADAAEQLQELVEVEEVEEVAEEAPGPSDEALVPILVDEEAEQAGEAAAEEDPEPILRSLANSLPDKSFAESDITLINARGKTAHAAREGAKTQQSSEALDVFRLLLMVCFRIRATDIHVEPKNEYWQVRLRVDGTMVDVVRLTQELGVRVTSLVKVLSDIDISQKNAVQEGHYSARVPGRRVDYRVSFAPSVFGQKLVIRILDTAHTPLHVKDLQLPQWMFDDIRRAIQQEAGMVLVCGPTGSGKTTTLYAVVRDIDVDQRNVVTIEDPVEIQLGGVTQIPVNESQGNTFSSLLRSVLRQDPDVILVGEIRDAETARIAMQAAMTGHLVFSTVHSRDTLGTVFRLLDLGVEPYLVASGLHMVLAQRLVRVLCRFCKVPVKPTAEQIERLGAVGKGVEQLFVPKGCERCLRTGYAGRRAIFELLSTNEQLRDVILHSPSAADMQKALGSTKFQRLGQTGLGLVAEGITALDEIERAV